MAADRSRLAAALAYEEERRRRMMESVPGLVTDPAQPAPRADFRTNLENLSIGLGEGLTNQLEGVKSIVTDPVGTARGVYEAGKAVIRDPSVIADALRYTAEKATSGPLGAGEVIGEMLGPRKGGPVMQELDVYHGTPHKFPATEAASSYRETRWQDDELVKKLKTPNLTKDEYNTLGELTRKSRSGVEQLSKAEEKTLAKLQGQQIRQVKELVALRKTVGTTYKADLPDEMIGNMIDYDKPLGKQSKAIQETVKQFGDFEPSDSGKFVMESIASGLRIADGSPTGRRLEFPYSTPESIARERAYPAQIAEKLRAAGIPGVVYRDAGSRGKSGSGTRNFVVFPGEEKKVRILERDGQKAPPQKIAQALETTTQKITEAEFETLAKTGKIHTAKSPTQELESLRKGQSQVAEIQADADTVEGDELLESLKQEGYAIEQSPQAFDSWIVGKDKEAIARLKNANSPIEFGRAYGYSDADIAQFYIRRRGGNKGIAYREYLSDLGRK